MNSLRRQISRPRNLRSTTPRGTHYLHVLCSNSKTPLSSPSTPHAPEPPPAASSPSNANNRSSITPSPRQLNCRQLQPNSSMMAANTNHLLCVLLMSLSIFPSLYVIYTSHRVPSCNCQTPTINPPPINLLSFPSAWNNVPFTTSLPKTLLKIAVFVKRWPHRTLAGGLERHALTLHLSLAKRGHEVHVFTTNSTTIPPTYPNANIHIHVTPPTAAGYLNQPLAWEQLLHHNSTGRQFDLIHTESVGLFHGRARGISNLAVSWHGIAYETIHSDIVQDLLRNPDEPRRPSITDRVSKVVEEVKFFQDYAHHVATSDHVGDVLRRVYMIPEERVHVILNGVDEEIYKPDAAGRSRFWREMGLAEEEEGKMVIGLAGRLVKDKGHPIMFEALKQLFQEEDGFRREVLVLVAGDGPWGRRYKSLGPNMVVLGALDQTQLAKFYNCLDVLVNPTLRAQGLDHTFLEAMMSGVPVMGTRFASITGSVVVSPEMGYTFLPTVGSLKEALRGVWREGPGRTLKRKGEVARRRALQVFTAAKMAIAYERLFLCITQIDDDYCRYPPSMEHQAGD